jgi:hypothetical protein
MPDHFSSACWHARGEETRMLAEGMENENIRRTMVEIADQYDKLASSPRRRSADPQRPYPSIQGDVTAAAPTHAVVVVTTGKERGITTR